MSTTRGQGRTTQREKEDECPLEGERDEGERTSVADEGRHVAPVPEGMARLSRALVRIALERERGNTVAR